jgi:hypothetical protein
MTETVSWTSASEKQYAYFIYALPRIFATGQIGNYIFTKIFNHVWGPVYIGQGDLRERGDIDSHHRGYCLKQKGATHIHAHLNENEANRIVEKKDLPAGHPEAFEPDGCNQRTS